MADGAPQKKPRGKLKLLLLAAVVMLGLGGGSFWWFYGRKPAETNPEPKSEVRAVLHLENFTVNLAAQGENSFLRVGIDLGLDVEPSGGHGEKPPPTALIRDTILGILGTRTADDLLTPGGKTKLKEELVRALQVRDPKLGVREVYFTDFLVQR